MQIVIPSAGRGSRMNSLTDALPKPLLEVNGKTLLEHKFDALPEGVTEIILIVGYMASMIQQKFGGAYKDKKITYIEQDVLDGTAGALWRAKEILSDRFLVMNGDDLYKREDVSHCMAMNEWVMLVQQTDHVRSGSVRIEENGTVLGIEEGDHSGPGLMNTGLYALDMRIFDYPMIPKAEGNTEYGLPQTIVEASRKSGIPFLAVKATAWIQITSPDDIQKAEQLLNQA